MKGLRHEMISASAGSGKTYELVRRYLHLLSLGVEPERIAAMTFTRKAAGEFFNRILRRLGELSVGATNPDEYFKGMSPLPAAWPDFVDVTRKLLRHMHRLRLGTLDSFFANVTACFPMELGLPVGAAVMAEEDAKRALDEALDGVMDAVYSDEAGGGVTTLLEAYKLGTYGQENKSVLRSLRSWIENAHQLWLECPNDKAWGGASVIWPDKSAFVWHKAEARSDLAKRLRFCGERQNWSEDGHEKWERLIAQLQSHQPGLKLEKPLADLLEKCAESWSRLLAGDAEFLWMRRKTKFTGEDAALLVAFAKQIVAAELLVRCQRTTGVASVIKEYERGYHRLVRQQGRLSFADVQRLLADAQAKVFGESGSGTADLWYRMDARHDHWLFDEFQDTSVQQWQVVGDLVDEVLQDTSGQRSFFAVGDTKQSIYMWRRAEPGLFRAVEAKYHREGREEGLQKRQLANSYRSCQQVLDVVNAVFGDSAALDTLLPGCLAGWEFAEHKSARTDLRGHAALLCASPNSDEEVNPRWSVVAKLINEIQPPKRGLTCAVLMRGNANAAALAEYLRAATGMEVITESQQKPAVDNPVTLALLSVLQLAAHPADTFAIEHLRMTPLAQVLADEFRDDAGLLAAETLLVIEGNGFASFVEEWAERIEALVSDAPDAFAECRLDQLLDMASEFDESGDRGIDAFLEFARDHGMRVQGAETAIQVMTVHKSKGLEFDVVILPDLDGTGMKSVGALQLVKKQPLFGSPEWILQWPTEVVSQFDPTLVAVNEQLAQREGFEGLCRLYVAMTRAKLGLYMITKPPPKKEAAVSEARLLREMLQRTEAKPMVIGESQFECSAQIGESNWFESHELKEAAFVELTAKEQGPIGKLLREVQPLARRLTPSEEEAFRITGETLFAPGREKGRNFGSLVHALLAEVEWTDGVTDESLYTMWSALGHDRIDGYEEAATQAVRVLKSEETAHVFARPQTPCSLWRERAFDLVHKGEWVSGIVDRAVIERTPSGAAVGAWLIDFKTDTVMDDAQLAEKIEGYTPQIKLYRDALRRLTGLADTAIRASLIFTRLVCEVRI